MIVNVSSVATGQQFAPGNEVLLPFEMATAAWKAFNAGARAGRHICNRSKDS